jgi:ATP-binding cassette subfamily C protein
VGALLAINGEISAGSIIAASIILGRALQPVESLVGGWATLTNARTALANLAALFEQVNTSVVPKTALPEPRGLIELEQVSVRAPQTQRAILIGVTIRASPGEILGIVGPSGSGKTTLAKVIAGVIRPDAGTIRIDSAQYEDWDNDELARHVGYLPQEPSLFDGTVKDNISRFARWRGEDAEIVDQKTIEAARSAGVHELILRLPGGYDAALSGSAGGLSAGQAQRVALARALYGSPSLLVLDEPNAFLDAEGEAALTQAVEAARDRGACVIVIAHRQRVLQSANRLLVLDGGKPLLFGSRDEVLARLAAPAARQSAA